MWVQDLVVVLDERGKEATSEGLAALLAKVCSHILIAQPQAKLLSVLCSPCSPCGCIMTACTWFHFQQGGHSGDAGLLSWPGNLLVA